MDSSGSSDINRPVPAELQAVIGAFEKILDAFPSDRLALDTLADAYDQMGDTQRAFHYLDRLAQVVLADSDRTTAQTLADRLRKHSSREGVSELVHQLELLSSTPTEAPVAAAGTEPSGISRSSGDITNEVSLAWELLQGGRITQDEYAALVRDLSEVSSRRPDVPVTVMHVLADKGFAGLDAIVAFISKLSGCPFIPLSGFELNPEHFNLLPQDFPYRRGALVFDVMGSDALVALLNPIDRDLRQDVERILKRRCHFYTVTASEYDHAVQAMKKLAAAKTAT